MHNLDKWVKGGQTRRMNQTVQPALIGRGDGRGEHLVIRLLCVNP